MLPSKNNAKPQKSQQNKGRQNGQGLVEYALILLLVAAATTLTLAATGTTVGDVFSQVINGVDGQEGNPGHIVVSVVDTAGKGIANVRVYMFNEKGRYQRRSGRTDPQGNLIFEDVADGRYQFRADYQTKRFWSEPISWSSEWHAVVQTGQRPFTVNVVDNNGDGIQNVRVYAYNDKDRYTGVFGNTDDQGQLSLNLTDGPLKFRADYQTRRYWSDVVNLPETTEAIVNTGQRPFTINVVDNNGDGIQNVRVYAFNEKGRYTGIYGNSDDKGQLSLNLADGLLKFRADYQTQQYWSDVVNSPAVTEATIKTGQQAVTVHVVADSGAGIPNVRVYAFNDKNRYTGVYGNSDGYGQVVLDLGQGAWKFRADYQAKQFWSELINSPTNSEATVKTGQRPFTITVIDQHNNGMANVRVYAFKENGRYMGGGGRTNANGNLILNLADGDMKFRADYSGKSYWSAVVNSPNSVAAAITVQN